MEELSMKFFYEVHRNSIKFAKLVRNFLQIIQCSLKICNLFSTSTKLPELLQCSFFLFQALLIEHLDMNIYELLLISGKTLNHFYEYSWTSWKFPEINVCTQNFIDLCYEGLILMLIVLRSFLNLYGLWWSSMKFAALLWSLTKFIQPLRKSLNFLKVHWTTTHFYEVHAKFPKVSWTCTKFSELLHVHSTSINCLKLKEGPRSFIRFS